jgi:hypothetical protein
MRQNNAKKNKNNMYLKGGGVSPSPLPRQLADAFGNFAEGRADDCSKNVGAWRYCATAGDESDGLAFEINEINVAQHECERKSCGMHGGCSPAAVAQLIDNVWAGERKRDAAHDSAEGK